MEKILLVNKKNPLPECYFPSLTKADGKLCAEDCAKGYLQMKAAAARHGLKLRILSAYRTGEYQRTLFLSEVKKLKDEGLASEEAYFLANRSVALPGFSEHQTGLALDIVREGEVEVDERFSRSEEYAWLCENAADFGFILRYPPNKEEITGYIFEPWHFRFVGEEAIKIFRSKLTLEEYVGEGSRLFNEQLTMNE